MRNRYKERIVERFSNAFVKDELNRVAQDGSSKLYSTTRSSVLQLLERRKNIVKLSIALAAWILYFASDQAEGIPIVPCDPKVEHSGWLFRTHRLTCRIFECVSWSALKSEFHAPGVLCVRRLMLCKVWLD